MIEVDGPAHFSTDRNGVLKELGSTAWKRRVLQACGSEVLNIHYRTWRNVRTKEEQREYLQRHLLLSRAGPHVMGDGLDLADPLDLGLEFATEGGSHLHHREWTLIRKGSHDKTEG